MLANDNYNGQAVYNGQAGTMMALGTLNPPQQGSIDKISTAGYSTLTNLVKAPCFINEMLYCVFIKTISCSL